MKKNPQIKNNISLAPLTTFGIGGNALQYTKVNDIDELLEVLQWAYQNEVPSKLFACGSNIVFPDEGIEELVIHINGGTIKTEGDIISVDAGVLLAEVIDDSIGHCLQGLEKLSGIPGTIGGAVFGNAGAYGTTISDVIEKIQIWNKGSVEWLSKEECNFSYRHSIFKEKRFVILQVICILQPGNCEQLKKISENIITLRLQKYHPGLKCPGSFFKNIVSSSLSSEILAKIPSNKIKYGKIPAGLLLEEIGARGMRVGDIAVADYHGNLLINVGNGKSSDVKKLALLLKKKVNKRFGIELEEEVRYF